MKRPITPAYTFTPGSSTLNLSGIAGFNVANLFAVIDLKTGALIYAPLAGYGYTALSGITLTLAASMAGLAAGDPLMIIYDDAAAPLARAAAGDTSIAVGGTAQTLFGGTTSANGWKVANPDPAEDLWVSDSTMAAPNGQGSYRIPAGGIVTTEPNERPVGPVSVYGASTGHLVTARSW
ncbi:hypothetical protein [Jatrophihabitans endophyticus]|uniref:hypothetical protein n=1 Tax=Jatrophihabitans endophyticus TaxID=1206085 RepID=UPI0019FCD24C|nr:hypothetical protein [Jatrophihabitans endophyticus]MBE7190093.1 hypothetical protein [Jatrophihabitans endophyticus]